MKYLIEIEITHKKGCASYIFRVDGTDVIDAIRKAMTLVGRDEDYQEIDVVNEVRIIPTLQVERQVNLF